METLFELIFADNQIVTDDFFAKETDQHIDAANKIMYEFYLANKNKLNTFFLVIRKETNSGMRLDRLSEEQLAHRLNDRDYAETVLNVKVWAFYDKNKGDLDVSHIFNATDANLHCIQNLCQKMRDITIKKPQQSIKMGSQTSKTSSQNSIKKSTTTVTPTSTTPFVAINKSKSLTDSNPSKGNTGKQPVLAEISNQSSKNKLKSAKSIEEEPIKEEPEKINPKKRKERTTDTMAQEIGKDKELKKTKLTREASVEELPKNNIFAEAKAHAKPQNTQKNTQNAKNQNAIEIEDDEETFYGEPVVNNQNTQQKKAGNSFEEEIETKQPVKEHAKPVNSQPAPAKEHVKPVNTQTQQKTSSPNVEKKVLSTRMNEEVAPGGDDDEYIQVRRVRQVPQDKSYMDAKGYLVMEKGYVEEEYFEMVKKKDLAPSQSKPQPGSQGKSQKPVEKSQSTLGSFFKKK